MFRKKIKEQTINRPTHFRFRGTDNTRIEALSDGVFAIATALLVISSSMPETFNDLLKFLEDLIPFAVCMTMLMLIWYQHYVFFIRYGFKDAKIVAINTLLLFLILFYVYPLKFLFKLLYQMFPAMMSGDQEKLNHLFTKIMPSNEAPVLMSIYGFGAAAIFFTLTWMYFIAWKRRNQLELTKLEAFQTKSSMVSNLLMGLVPMVSFVISISVSDSITAFSYSGMVYMIYPILMPVFGYISWSQQEKLLTKIQNEL